MIIEQSSSSRLRITEERNGEEQLILGLNTGVPAGGFPAQRIGALSRRGGILVTNGTVRPWQVTKILPHDGVLFLCGQWLDGYTIGEHLSHSAPASTATVNTPSLAELIGAVTGAYAYARRWETHTVCNADTSIITSDGTCLLLDTDLATEINRYLPLERRRRAVFPYRFSRLERPAALAYECGAVLWNVLTSTPLCTGSTQDESDLCHDAVRNSPAIHRLKPSVHPIVAELVNRLIREPEVALREGTMEELVSTVKTVPVLEDIDSDETAKRRQLAQQAFEKRQREWRRRRFFRRRGTVIAASIVIALVAGAIPFQIVRNRLAPPVTAGLSPERLATLFYESWAMLDHETMDDALAKGVAAGILREVTNLYVVDRVQFAHSMEDRVIPAAEWIARGRPESRIPYGPIIESMSVTGQGADSVEITVDYTMWRPDGESAEASLSATKTVLRDRLTISPSRWGWEITALDTTVIAGPSRP